MKSLPLPTPADQRHCYEAGERGQSAEPRLDVLVFKDRQASSRRDRDEWKNGHVRQRGPSELKERSRGKMGIEISERPLAAGRCVVACRRHAEGSVVPCETDAKQGETQRDAMTIG
nr:hypothetical protein [Sphingomonas gellani]